MPARATPSVFAATALLALSLGVGALSPLLTPSAGAVVPGRNSTIAFVSDRDGDYEIYYLPIDGGTAVPKTDNAASDRTPRFSPDGSQVVFSSDRDGNDEIYVMDAFGTNQVNVTDSVTSSDIDPAWSPDGTQVAFTSNRTGDYEIFTMDVDGTNVVNRTNTPAADEGGADWSPDGTKIAFTSNRDGNYEVYKMNADGTNPRRLTTDPHADTQPAWSPDGARLAFVSDRFGTTPYRTDVFTMAPGGTDQTRLTTEAAAVDEWPAWSPNGNKILFSSDRTGDTELYRMDGDGGGVTRLTTSPGVDAQPDQLGFPDHQPDLLIRRAEQSSWSGDDVYNSTGAGQSRSISLARGGRAVLYVRATNDGSVPDILKLRGTPGNESVTVRYALLNATIAAPVEADTWRVLTGSIAPSVLDPTAGVTVKVVITMSPTAPTVAHADGTVTAISTGDRTRQDTVRFEVTRR